VRAAGPCICALAAEVALPAPAPAQQLAIDIPSAPLTAALAQLSRQTGIAIGYEGRLPDVRAPHVKGRMSAGEALARLLRGSGLDSVRLGPAAFRLIRHVEPTHRRPLPVVVPPPAPAPATAADDDGPGAAIVVTGSKRSEPLSTLPISVAVADMPDDPARGGRPLPSAADVALQIEGLAVAGLGPGRNRQFIRGVADSPFNGSTQSTVAILVNDARITYNAPDPDLRLVDVERVEVLKGPQGPLYGTGALGGVYHIVTRAPDLRAPDAMATLGGTWLPDGDFGGSAQAMLNLPVSRDRLAVRAVAYTAREPGWIESGAREDVNAGRVTGVRGALRALPTESWTVDLIGLAQWQNVSDSQYVLAGHALDRPAQLAEPHDNDFAMASARAERRIGALDLVIASSFIDHDLTTVLDASAAAATFGRSGAVAYEEHRRNRIINQEVRLSRGGGHGIGWVAGLSYLDALNRIDGAVSAPGGGDPASLLSSRQTVREFAAFGDLSMPLTRRIAISAGLRVFRAETEEGRGSRTNSAMAGEAKTGATPSVSLSWRRGGDFIHLRYAGALRPGGLSETQAGIIERFKSDELQTVELGWRHHAGERLTLEASGYYTFWNHVQSDYLLDDGLVATRNAGNAEIHGAELSVAWRPSRAWHLSAGVVGQRAILVKGEDGTPLTGDPRMPVVPEWTLRLSARRAVAMLGWQGEAGAALNYVGPSRLSFDSGLDRPMGDYMLLRGGIGLRRGPWRVGLSADNLLDARADCFAFGNPFSVRVTPQYTPLRPRLVSASLGWSW
jgi:iron complex outermembrane receptor protein